MESCGRYFFLIIIKKSSDKKDGSATIFVILQSTSELTRSESLAIDAAIAGYNGSEICCLYQRKI